MSQSFQVSFNNQPPVTAEDVTTLMGNRPAAVAATPKQTPQRQGYQDGYQQGKVRARYEAAQNTSENIPLFAYADYLSARSANSIEVRRNLKIRSRYEAANNSYFRGIVDSVVNDLIGREPRLQVLLPDPQDNARVEEAWRSWSRAINLSNKLRILSKTKLVDGEGFGLLVNNPTLHRTFGSRVSPTGHVDPYPPPTTDLDVDDAVQLDFVVVESDQCTTPDIGLGNYYWVDGVVLDRLGNIIQYHFLRSHPGDYYVPYMNPLEYDKWSPANVVHWFKCDRPGQVRGVPEITPALELFAQLRRYTKAVLAAAEAAADIAGVLQTESHAFDSNEVSSPFQTMPFDRGMWLTLPMNVKASQLKAEQPTTTYENFVRVLLREICRCLDVPLNIALGDSSGYNYSSGRLDHLQYHRRQRVDRYECECVVLDKVFSAWSEEAVMIQNLLPPGLSPHRIPHRWHWDSSESIDPQKDALADQIRLGNGSITLDDICSERGVEWEDVVRQLAKERAALREIGLVYGERGWLTDVSQEMPELADLDPTMKAQAVEVMKAAAREYLYGTGRS